ncbi:MAG: four helix bundle protein [bacterium]
MRDYRKIVAWKLADDLTVAIYECTHTFPSNEQYGMTSQLRRVAYSVPANIAEGSSRESQKDYLHFLHIARGSLSETQYFIHLANRLGYISAVLREGLDVQVSETFRKLHGLIQAVKEELPKSVVRSP